MQASDVEYVGIRMSVDAKRLISWDVPIDETIDRTKLSSQSRFIGEVMKSDRKVRKI
jgi:hypothetical protein